MRMLSKWIFIGKTTQERWKHRKAICVEKRDLVWETEYDSMNSDSKKFRTYIVFYRLEHSKKETLLWPNTITLQFLRNAHNWLNFFFVTHKLESAVDESYWMRLIVRRINLSTVFSSLFRTRMISSTYTLNLRPRFRQRENSIRDQK